ncbi:hypothetical protein GUJ93_ZPchr0010g7571 [Zizania palustris]|uniref:Uncharacterized protein n=1 Tax=Zizania palustris TaxID=103762 RepID=A0A8J5WD14_ZIZPA|nr:hypothetical protein GUJ93_ZPchr0010g7571 [Zizania palustris]
MDLLVPSVLGFKYYLAILNDCSYHLWTFPLRHKSDTFSTIAHFSPLLPPNLAPPSKVCNVTMVGSSTILSLVLSSSHMVLLSVSCVHTRRKKMAKPSVFCAPSTTSSDPSSSKPISLLPLGWTLSTLPPTFSTAIPQKLYSFPPPTTPSMDARPLILISMFLAVGSIPTHLPLLPTNSLLAPSYVSFSATLSIKKVINV